MRILELLVVVTVIVSAINLVILKRKGLRVVLPGLSVVLCAVSLLCEGYRNHMIPAYVLALLFFAIDVAHHYARPRKVNKGFKIVGIVLLSLFVLVSAASPALFPVVKMPEPDGPHLVGTEYMSFSDAARKGIFTASDQPRDIGVQVWYPTDDIKGKKAANMLPNRKASEYLAQSMLMPNLFDHLSLVKTHSYLDAALSGKESSYPVVLFSGGYGGFNGQNVVLMEALASRGYVVFGVSHPYEDFASTYPGGILIRFNAEQATRLQHELLDISKRYGGDTSSADFEKYQVQNAKVSNESIHIWSDDMKFVADEIEKLNSGELQSRFKGKLDTARMGIFGHSFGGATAGQACLEDSRFKAFINMDGAPFGDSVNRVIPQPFMILMGDGHQNLIPAGYSPEQKNYAAVTINGAKHMDFTDFSILLPQFKYLGVLGSIDGSKQEAILKDYVTAFFDKHLKGEKAPLIDGGVQKYPEVTVKLK